MDSPNFTFYEVLSFVGVLQCVYLLVHMGFKAGSFIRIMLPFTYFFVLGSAFFSDLARRFIHDLTPYYDVFGWLAWALVPPLSVLLIIQMSNVRRFPSLASWLILLVVPIAFGLSYLAHTYTDQQCSLSAQCYGFISWLNVTGVIAGAISLLTIWTRRNVFEDILEQKAGQERYWLILALIIVNVAFLTLTVVHTSGYKINLDAYLLRTVLGLSFIYLVSTSLLRIYPVALFLPYQSKEDQGLNIEEKGIAAKIEKLMNLDKIYHEPSYSRSDLAREIGLSEGVISRIINVHFGKSFPQLLNEYRVDDSKRLLLETQVSIKVVSEEVGFNSLPSFNRVFKDNVGQSPSSYRKNMIK